jgi:transposase/IS5 family transposase
MPWGDSDMDMPNARIMKPCRNQIQLRQVDLDSLLAADHPARIVWAFVERLDLSPLYARIKAVGERPGRPTIDPRILIALWLLATLDGVGSARELDRLCGEHDAYRWICGGVEVNYHTLSDFRVDNVEFLDQTLTRSVAALMLTGSVTLNRVAQDGVRVRASAGSGSFRRRKRLQEFLKLAEEQVNLLREEVAADPAACTKRQQAARERAARERQERVSQALTEMELLEAHRAETDDKGRKRKKPRQPGDKPDKREEPRASTTDPEARRMKGPDGGTRPSYNAQFCTDTASQIIVGVSVDNGGTDSHQMPPMTEQVHKRYGRIPKETLVDGGFAVKESIELTSALGTTVYAPVAESRSDKRQKNQPVRGDSPTIAEWRLRMATEQAKAIYKERAATAECVNAQARNRGLRFFLVRGIKKVRAVLLWYALAHNLWRIAHPMAQPAAA